MTVDSPELTFAIPGEPVAKGRPRFVRRGPGVRAVTPKKTRDYEQLVESCARRAAVEAGGWRVGARVPLELEVLFVFKRPKNRFRIADEGAGLGATRRAYKVTKGDLDNHIKAVLDGLQAADLFADDAQVVSIKSEKTIGTILNRREKAAEAPFALVTLRVLPALPGE